MKRAFPVLAFLLVLAVPAVAAAFSDTWSQAVWTDLGGNKIQLTLSTDRIAADNSEVLLGFFFSGPSLTPDEAWVPAGEEFVVNGGGSGPGLPADLSGEWAYKYGVVGLLPGGGNQGIAGAGYGVFGPPDLFDPNKSGLLGYGGEPPNGGDFGLTNGSFVSVGYEILIKNSAVFTFFYDGDEPPVFDNAYFQYGTTLDRVPEPGTMLLLGVGLVGVGLYRRSKKK